MAFVQSPNHRVAYKPACLPFNMPACFIVPHTVLPTPDLTQLSQKWGLKSPKVLCVLLIDISGLFARTLLFNTTSSQQSATLQYYQIQEYQKTSLGLTEMLCTPSFHPQRLLLHRQVAEMLLEEFMDSSDVGNVPGQEPAQTWALHRVAVLTAGGGLQSTPHQLLASPQQLRKKRGASLHRVDSHRAGPEALSALVYQFLQGSFLISSRERGRLLSEGCGCFPKGKEILRSHGPGRVTFVVVEQQNPVQQFTRISADTNEPHVCCGQCETPTQRPARCRTPFL